MIFFSKKSTLVRTVYAWVLGLLLIALAVLSLAQVQAAPQMARTAVDGIWGLAPNTLTSSGSQTLTPTVSLYLVAPTSTLTLTLASGEAKPGDVLVIGSTTTTSTIVLTTNTALAASRTISKNDVLEFRYFNSQWVESNYKDNTAN